MFIQKWITDGKVATFPDFTVNFRILYSSYSFCKKSLFSAIKCECSIAAFASGNLLPHLELGLVLPILAALVFPAKLLLVQLLRHASGGLLPSSAFELPPQCPRRTGLHPTHLRCPNLLVAGQYHRPAAANDEPPKCAGPEPLRAN
ncbi:unnamed protein product [Leptidea sinapis]|uniref:Uncharacterized protein n=1 Tax=Leptidea sinapis TaxID=189913 RepID=A0A5E4QDK3_9NEOP|nr:unnamed protein product [Leptidea sinapis]